MNEKLCFLCIAMVFFAIVVCETDEYRKVKKKCTKKAKAIITEDAYYKRFHHPRCKYVINDVEYEEVPEYNLGMIIALAGTIMMLGFMIFI